MIDYLSLFPSATRSKPRFMTLASAVLRQAEDLLSAAESLPSAYALGHATGLQLTALGESLGVPRPPAMPDESFEALLRMKLARWRWDGANDTAAPILAEIDPGGLLTDNADGTVSATPSGPLPADVKDLYPIPAGIALRA